MPQFCSDRAPDWWEHPGATQLLFLKSVCPIENSWIMVPACTWSFASSIFYSITHTKQTHLKATRPVEDWGEEVSDRGSWSKSMYQCRRLGMCIQNASLSRKMCSKLALTSKGCWTHTNLTWFYLQKGCQPFFKYYTLRVCERTLTIFFF